MADGAITLPDGVPAQVTVERPRQQGHGDYATNVALQLAKKAGTEPPRLRRPRRRPAPRRRRRRRGRGRGSGLPQRDGGGRGAGPGRRRHRRGGRRRTAARRPWPASRSTSSSSRPTRPARCTWVTRGGPCSATPSARVLEAAGADGGARVLHQRPRQPDGPFRRLPRGVRARQPDPGGRLPGRLHRRPGGGDRPPAAGHRRPARGRAARRLPRGGLRVAAAGAAGPARRLQHALRRVVLRARPPCRRVARLGGRHPAQPQGQRPPLRGRRRAVDAHHGLRRRQGPGAHPFQRRAHHLADLQPGVRQLRHPLCADLGAGRGSRAGAGLRDCASPPRPIRSPRRSGACYFSCSGEDGGYAAMLAMAMFAFGAACGACTCSGKECFGVCGRCAGGVRRRDPRAVPVPGRARVRGHPVPGAGGGGRRARGPVAQAGLQQYAESSRGEGKSKGNVYLAKQLSKTPNRATSTGSSSPPNPVPAGSRCAWSATSSPTARPDS